MYHQRKREERSFVVLSCAPLVMVFLSHYDGGALHALSRGFLFPTGHVTREPEFISLQSGSEWRFFGHLHPVTLYVLFPDCEGRARQNTSSVHSGVMDVLIQENYYCSTHSVCGGYYVTLLTLSTIVQFQLSSRSIIKYFPIKF